MSLPYNQFSFGIEGLLEDEVVKLAPARVDSRGLVKLSNADLLRLRNICNVETAYFQDAKHGRRLFDRLDRIEAEMERRGLMQWLTTPCSACGDRLVLSAPGGELMGACQCTQALNEEIRK